MLAVLVILALSAAPCLSIDEATEHQLRQYIPNHSRNIYQPSKPVFAVPPPTYNQPPRQQPNDYKSQWNNIFNSQMFNLPPKYQPRISNYREQLPIPPPQQQINIKSFNQRPHQGSGRSKSRQFHFEKSPIAPKISQCGRMKPQISNYVANGKATSHVEWPWYVQLIIRSDAEAYCGGTLISENFILTAAHCFDDIPAYALARSTTVLLKGVRIRSPVSRQKYKEVKIKATNVFIHPEYVPAMGSAEAASLGIEPGPRNDLAIIRIKVRSKEVLKQMTPVCLPANDYQVPIDTKCKIMGHGFVDAYAEDNFEMPTKLQVADVHISGNDICKAEVDSKAIKSKINDDTLCIRGPIHPCVGDSGGPLICKGENPKRIEGESDYDDYDDAEDTEWYLAGVTSFAVSTDLNDKCGLFKSAVFGKVANNMEWIKNICRF